MNSQVSPVVNVVLSHAGLQFPLWSVQSAWQLPFLSVKFSCVVFPEVIVAMLMLSS